MTPITITRILLALSGLGGAIAAAPSLDWRTLLALSAAWVGGIASYNIDGKVTVPK